MYITTLKPYIKITFKLFFSKFNEMYINCAHRAQKIFNMWGVYIGWGGEELVKMAGNRSIWAET